MNIHEAAKKLIDLGIPGEEKKRAITKAIESRPFKNKTADVKTPFEVCREDPRAVGVHRGDYYETGTA